MKKGLSFLLLLAAITAVSGCVVRPPHGDVRVRGDDYAVRVVFSDHDRGLIRDYYRDHYHRLPPGVAKRIQRDRPIPPGLEWRYLPDDLVRRLHRLPDGYNYVIIDNDVAILNLHTRIVVDLID
jgi:hypothetical protein